MTVREGDDASAPAAGPRPAPAVAVAIGIGIALLPIVVAAVRAVLDGWLPLGDNGYFTARSLDVGGSAHPLVGAYSSGSRSFDEPLNNLGPLQLDLLAPFTRADPEAGTAVGVAAVNAAAVVGVALVVRRLAATPMVLVALAATALVTWTMGSELLLEPRQHHALMLPWLCYVVLCWGLAAGDRWLLPWAAGVGSLLVQTHFSYLVIVTVLGLWAVGGLVDATRRAAPPAERWARLRAPVSATAGVVAVAWAQPLLDQVTGTGNLGRLLTGSGSDASGPGLAAGVRIVGGVATSPGTWLRGGFRSFDPGRAAAGGLVSPTAAAVVVLVALLAAAAARAHRRADRAAALAPATAAVALVAGVLAVARTPAGAAGPVVGNYRWLWPLAGFTLFALVMGWVSGPRRRGRPPLAVRRAGVVGAALLLVLVAANLGSTNQIDPRRDDLRQREVAADLLGDLDRASLPPVVFFDRSEAVFTEPYSYLVITHLRERGTDFTLEAAVDDVARFGEARRDGGRAPHRLVLLTGPAAREVPDGWRRVAFASSLTAADLDQREILLQRVSVAVAEGDLRPTGAGRRAVADGDYPAVAALQAGTLPSDLLVRFEVARLLADGHLAGSDADLAAVARMAELERRETFETAALFVHRRR